MTQSRRFEVGAAFEAALRDAPALAGVKFRRNPRDPSSIKDGPRVIFLEDQRDVFVDDKGQQGLRKYTFALGVIHRSETPEDNADADHVAAEAALRAVAYSMARTDGTTPQLREIETVFKVEGVDVGGALILTTFEYQYRRPKPAINY